MQEVFYEESVDTHNQKGAQRRYTVFTVIMWLMIVSAALCSMNIWFAPVPDEKFTTGVIVNLVIWIVFTVVFIAGAIFFARKRHSFFLSYDYTFVTGELRISKVIHSRRRKLMFRFSTDRIAKIGRVGSESYKKLKASPDIKEVVLTANAEAEEEKEFFYIQAQTDAGKRLLVLECRIQLISQIVRFMKKNILESEFNR